MKVRLIVLGLLESGGEVFWVVPLSFVGVRDESKELCPSGVDNANAGRAFNSALDVSSLLEFRGVSVASEFEVAVGDGSSIGSGLSVL